MEEIRKEVTRYKSIDGWEFNTEWECRAHNFVAYTHRIHLHIVEKNPFMLIATGSHQAIYVAHFDNEDDARMLYEIPDVIEGMTYVDDIAWFDGSGKYLDSDEVVTGDVVIVRDDYCIDVFAADKFIAESLKTSSGMYCALNMMRTELNNKEGK